MGESAKRNSDCQEELELALKARELFLKEHPDLQSFQDEIDQILAKTVGPENRMKALAFLIDRKLCELHDSVADLHTTIQTQYDNMRNANTDLIFNDRDISTDYLN